VRRSRERGAKVLRLVSRGSSLFRIKSMGESGIFSSILCLTFIHPQTKHTYPVKKKIFGDDYSSTENLAKMRFENEHRKQRTATSTKEQ